MHLDVRCSAVMSSTEAATLVLRTPTLHSSGKPYPHLCDRAFWSLAMTDSLLCCVWRLLLSSPVSTSVTTYIEHLLNIGHCSGAFLVLIHLPLWKVLKHKPWFHYSHFCRRKIKRDGGHQMAKVSEPISCRTLTDARQSSHCLGAEPFIVLSLPYV